MKNREIILESRVAELEEEIGRLRGGYNGWTQKFDDQDGNIIHQTKDNIPLPKTEDLVYLKGEMYCVMYLCFDYDKKTIEINIEHQ